MVLSQINNFFHSEKIEKKKHLVLVRLQLEYEGVKRG